MIAVLMTVHNRLQITLQCLRQLEGLSFDRCSYDLEIYLTDDGCTDGTPEAIRTQFPAVHIIEGNGTLYWNRGTYTAWKAAAKEDFDYYWWVNDDTFVQPDTLQRLLDSSTQHQDRSIIIGSTCASDDPGRITYGGWAKGALITDLLSEQRCETFNGNLVLIPRSVFQRLGTNDPYYRHALGDIDYGLRAGKASIEIWTVTGICGVCDTHKYRPVWMDPSKPIGQRWKHFHSPIGNNPFEYFHFRNRHYGLLAAMRSFVTNIIHFFFPNFWPSE